MLSVLAVPRGSPAVSILLRTARELRWSCTYERTCVFICACGCGTHVYITRTGSGHGLRTPYRAGCTARVNTGACLLHFACVRAVRCSAWLVRAVVYLACVYVCVRQSACAARLVPFVQRFVCQRGQMCVVCPTPCAVRLGSTGNVSICPCWYSHWYPLYSASLGQPGKCTYLPVLVLVLVPLVQCYAWSARAMYLFARVHTRAVRELLHSVYCACIPCTVLRLVSPGNVPICPCSYSYWYPLYSASLGQHGQCTYLPVLVLVLVPLVQCLAWTARAMYLFARACILVECFVMGNPSHVRILVFGLSRCTCIATSTDMDSLLVMSRDGFTYVVFVLAVCT